VYAGIGGAVGRNGFDSINARARTTGRQKLGWLGLSVARSVGSAVMPRSAILHAPARPEVAFLVDAAARREARFSRSDALFAALVQLESVDRAGRPGDHAGI
jgi:phytoene synthase